jgi:DMSO/TMAO reductase YedYZ molybdopterin-dependent catalytic subunit
VARRLTNDLLLALVLAQVLGGLLGWALPVETAAPLYSLHRALGVGLIVMLGWKQAIVLASLRRRVLRRRAWDRSVVWGSLAGVALLGTLALGLAWTFNLISFDWLWGYSPMNVHVALGIAVVPLVAFHMLQRRRENALSLPVLSRRSALRVSGLAVATLVGGQAIERLAPAVRKVSGSKQTDSFSANAFTAEIWLFDRVPVISSDTFQLSILNQSRSVPDLVAVHSPREVQAVLDCTSGWWSEQVWQGVGLLDVLRSAGLPGNARQIAVESVTGHRIELPVAELGNALLATHVGGEVLSAGHGYPVRLVVPGRRGYQWVKWVSRIDLA